MALKKPSELFNNEPKRQVEVSEQLLPENYDTYKSNVKNVEVLNDFISSYGTLKENLQKIDTLQDGIQSLKEELQNSITKEDLDAAVVSNLLILEKNIQKIELNLKGINRKDLKRIDEEIEDIENKVLYALEEEFPKYKKALKSNEIFLKDKFYEYSNEVNERVNQFEEFVANSFETLEENLQAINDNQLIDIRESVVNSSKELEALTSNTKKQIFGIETDVKEFYQKIKETISSYQKGQSEKISELEESIALFETEEVKKYQSLLQETKIQNDEKIQSFEQSLTEKYTTLTQSVSSLLEQIENKSVQIEETVENRLEELETTLTSSKNTLEETSNDYKKLIKSIEAKGLSDQQKYEKYRGDLSNLSNTIQGLTENLNHIQSDYLTKEDNQREIKSIQEEIFKKINLLENDIAFKENKIKKANQELTETIESITSQIGDLNANDIDKKYSQLSNKISYIEEVFEKFNEKTVLNEGLLNEPPTVKNTDPLTPLDKNFVTLDQLQEHYRLFINRIQQQLATLGGGGETRLEFLDDVDRDSAKVNGRFLKYDATSGKWVGALGGDGGGSQTLDDTLGFGNTSSRGMSVGVITSTTDISVGRNLSVVGITTLGSSNGIGTVTVGIGETALYVDGNARVVGILTVGRASITIDGDTNTITSGEVTITGSSITLGDNVTINAGATGINSAPNVLYVAKDGNDGNNGTSIDNAKLTIAGAVSIAQSGTVIKVLSGTYNENNPIEVPAFVSIVGDSLKTVTVVPNNATEDIFHLNKGTYLSHMTFTGHTSPSAAVAFPPTIATNVGGGLWESPYVQNCTSNTTTGTGMRIDGNLAEGLKSMVVDSYTQYNQGGVGIAITNNGYAQLVSVFTICCNEGITAYKGGQCSLTNSNTDFGTYGLVADGTSDLQFTGTASTASSGTDRVTVAITTLTTPYEGQVVYFGTLYQTIRSITVTDGGSGYTTTPSVSITAPSGPNGITATAFATLDGDRVSEITVVTSGTQYTEAPTITLSAPDTGTTATATAVMDPIYYTINSSTPISSGISTITLEENLNNTVSSGTTAYFYQVSKITASSHTFEYVGSGNDITTATPLRGGVPVQENEIVERDGGRVIYTSTDQSGNFRIGNDIVINQNNGTISGRAFTRSLFNQMTPFILALS